jgi:hypothetical protein
MTQALDDLKPGEIYVATAGTMQRGKVASNSLNGLTAQTALNALPKKVGRRLLAGRISEPNQPSAFRVPLDWNFEVARPSCHPH